MSDNMALKRFEIEGEISAIRPIFETVRADGGQSLVPIKLTVYSIFDGPSHVSHLADISAEGDRQSCSLAESGVQTPGLSQPHGSIDDLLGLEAVHFFRCHPQHFAEHFGAVLT